MNLRLFRFKIAAISAVLSGVVVALFGFFFLEAVDRVGLGRIDNILRALGEAQLRRPHPNDHWEKFERSLGAIFGGELSARISFRVSDPEGEILFTSTNWPTELQGVTIPPLTFEKGGGPETFTDSERSEGPGETSLQPALRMKTPAFKSYRSSGCLWRVGFTGNRFVTLMLAANTVEFRKATAVFMKVFFIGVPIALLALAVGGWLLAARALAPVTAITRTVGSITPRGLDRRVPVTNADEEFQELVTVINRMLDRLERSFHQAARFSADAAHELQTPLTILQGELDLAIHHAAYGSEEQQRYSRLLEEVGSLKTIVRKLLLLARADVGALTLSQEDVDLSALIHSTVEDVETVAPHLTVEADIEPDTHALADADLIGQAIRNMTSNAVKFSKEGGTVRFRLKAEGGLVSFSLGNTDGHIPEKDRSRVFDRFYRADKSRSRDRRGSGLGLSLAREFARAHGGDLILEPESQDQQGMVFFTLTLPRLVDTGTDPGY